MMFNVWNIQLEMFNNIQNVLRIKEVIIVSFLYMQWLLPNPWLLFSGVYIANNQHMSCIIFLVHGNTKIQTLIAATFKLNSVF